MEAILLNNILMLIYNFTLNKVSKDLLWLFLYLVLLVK